MTERVRRLASARVDPELRISVSSAVEAMVGLTLITGNDVRCENYDIGCGWFDDVRTGMSQELRDLLARLGPADSIHALWHTLLAAATEGPLDLPGFLRGLEAMPTEELWLQVLGFHQLADPAPEVRDAMLEAGRGSVEPLERLLSRDPRTDGRWIQGLARALGADAAGARGLILDILAHWYDDVFARQWEEIGPALERDAAEKRLLAGERPMAEVMEEATNGGEYVPEAGLSRLQLLPTYLARPWVIQGRHRGTLVIVYPAGDAALTASLEEAQRRRVLRLAKALSDDTRLRALRRLGESSCSLQELADELGIRKSTMHHHLAILRSAGLLRMRFGEKRYSLRTAPLAEASGLLGDYLGADGLRQQRRRR